MSQLSAYHTTDPIGRQLFFLALAQLDALPQHLSLPSRHFVCFLACDATTQTDDHLHTLATSLLRLGAVYVCAWGPDCRRVHDLFDLAVVQQEIEEAREYPIMTTWHTDETLDQVLWFALRLAHPDELYAPSCHAAIFVSVASPVWDEHIQRRLANVQAFVNDFSTSL